MLARLLAATFLALAVTACGGDDSGTLSTETQGSSASETPTGSPTTTATPDQPDPGTWETRAPMPTPRSEVAVAAVNGLIYVVGGFEESGSPSQKVEVYDPATDSWSEAPQMPAPRHHTAAVAWQGDLLVIGGYQSGFNDPRDTVFRYDPETQDWSENPPLSVARGGHAGTLHMGNPVVVGGAGADGISLTSAEWMDGMSEVWRPLDGELSERRDHLAAASVVLLEGDQGIQHLQAIGGRRDVDYGQNLDANESARLLGEFEQVAPLPTARSGIAAVTFDNKVYVFGGEGPEGAFDENEVYDPKTDTWSTASPMPTARHGLGAAEVDGVIYVIGGGPTPGLSVSGANEAFRP